METRDGPEFVQSLARGLAVIRAFGRDAPALTLTEVAGRTGMTRASARRFLLTLKSLGYIGSDDGKHFYLLPEVLNLGYAYLSSMPWWQVAQPYMEEVTAAVNESCSASVLNGTDIIYVARVSTHQVMTISLGVGSRLPAYVTSMGRVLLAHLSPAMLDAYFAEAKFEKLTERTITGENELRAVLAEVRAKGYSLIDQELEMGVRSVAVPILDRRGRVMAAINVGTHVARVSKVQLTGKILPILLDASSKITRALPHMGK